MTEVELYTKEDIKRAKKFEKRLDMAEALLIDGVLYSIEEVEDIMENFMKGSV